MKQVFSNSELPHIWAAQSQGSGRTSNGSFYFHNATIYSYGGHFPIATIKGDTVFFTLRSYSNTTRKHISKARAAVSHKNFINVWEVPTGNFDYLTTTHEANFKGWKRELSAVVAELGNKRIRNIGSRVNYAECIIGQIGKYCKYFNLPVTDKELKKLIETAKNPQFVELARAAAEKQAAAHEKKVKEAARAYDIYIEMWRERRDEEIKELPDNTKTLINFYANQAAAFTRLRFNPDTETVETSKGIEIPAEIAKRAYFALNGCLKSSCNGLSIPVLHYTITETGNDYIKAGCHTIPKTDVQYIATVLNWA